MGNYYRLESHLLSKSELPASSEIQIRAFSSRVKSVSHILTLKKNILILSSSISKESAKLGNVIEFGHEKLPHRGEATPKLSRIFSSKYYPDYVKQDFQDPSIWWSTLSRVAKLRKRPIHTEYVNLLLFKNALVASTHTVELNPPSN